MSQPFSMTGDRLPTSNTIPSQSFKVRLQPLMLTTAYHADRVVHMSDRSQMLLSSDADTYTDINSTPFISEATPSLDTKM
jgi:hypothetical protein